MQQEIESALLDLLEALEESKEKKGRWRWRRWRWRRSTVAQEVC